MADQNSNSNQSSISNNKESQRKLKILAFHGYRQNGTLFRGKIGSFRKAVSKYAQLFFVSAPHKIFSDEGGGDEGRIFELLLVSSVIKVLLLVKDNFNYK